MVDHEYVDRAAKAFVWAKDHPCDDTAEINAPDEYLKWARQLKIVGDATTVLTE